MSSDISKELRRKIDLIAQQPFYWIRKNIPEARVWEDELYDLIDRLKALWQEARLSRINLCLLLKWQKTDRDGREHSIEDLPELQKIQNASGSKLIFLIDLDGTIIGREQMDEEINWVDAQLISRELDCVVFWFGKGFEIFCKGMPWSPDNKAKILRETKSKQRDSLLPMDDYHKVLNAHFEKWIRDEARIDYWFKRNEILLPAPEKIFQKCLWNFLDREVDCIADREPMFPDRSRCDIRVFLDDYDLFFIEIKWIGFSAIRVRDKAEWSAEKPLEFSINRAIDGAHQTKTYVEKNNYIAFDHRIRLAIYLVYDAYPEPATPIDYGDDIRKFILLEPIEFRLVTSSPSKATKGIAVQKGLAKKGGRRPSKSNGQTRTRARV